VTSANLDLVRSIYADWERGYFSRADWAHPEIEYVVVDGPAPGHWTGLAEMANALRDIFSAWEDHRIEAVECRELDDERVLVFTRASGRGKASGLDLAQMRAEWMDVLRVRDGEVTTLISYFDREHALTDLGLEERAVTGESTTSDLVERVRRLTRAANRLDFDAAMSFYAPDAVWEGRASGMTLEGRTAIRGFWEDVTVAYEEFEWRSGEILDLGNGVVFGVARASGCPVGGTGRVELHVAIVAVWEEGLIVRETIYNDIDEARAAAERLAKERE
jgi:ketosteroid isomerase-like protein